MNSAEASSESPAPNAKRLLWAGSMAILAAGVGFAIRGGIFDNWGAEYGFTAGQLTHASGLLATYLTALALGGARIPAGRSM